MLLQELFDYKNVLIRKLVTDPQIVHLVNEDIDFEDAGSLIYTQIFPYEYLPETTEHGHTFICAEVDISRVQNKTFLYPTLYIWEFTHKSKLRLPSEDGGGVRTDRLCEAIARNISGSREFGLGELELYSVKRFAPMSDFSGKLMMYQAKDINRLYDPNKFVPNNRKENVYT